MLSVMQVSSAQTWRGGEQQIAYLHAELLDRGVDSTLLLRDQSALQQHAEQLRWAHDVWSFSSPISPVAAWTLAQQARASGCGLLHLHDSHSHRLYTVAVSVFGLRTPAVVSRKVMFAPKRASLAKYRHRQLRRIVAVSQATRQVLVDVGLNAAKISVIADAIDPLRFAPRAVELPLTSLLPTSDGNADEPIIATVGALSSEKDHLTFVETARAILARRPDCRFVVFGADGDASDAVRQRIDQHQLQHAVTLLGHRDDLSALLHQCDLFLFCSVSEGLGSSLLDAAAARLPIVSTNAGGIPEVITHQRNGLLAEVGDVEALASHCLHSLNNPAMATRLVEAGRQNLTRYSIEAQGEAYVALYSNAIAT